MASKHKSYWDANADFLPVFFFLQSSNTHDLLSENGMTNFLNSLHKTDRNIGLTYYQIPTLVTIVLFTLF